MIIMKVTMYKMIYLKDTIFYIKKYKTNKKERYLAITTNGIPLGFYKNPRCAINSIKKYIGISK